MCAVPFRSSLLAVRRVVRRERHCGVRYQIKVFARNVYKFMNKIGIEKGIWAALCFPLVESVAEREAHGFAGRPQIAAMLLHRERDYLLNPRSGTY